MAVRAVFACRAPRHDGDTEPEVYPGVYTGVYRGIQGTTSPGTLI